MQKGMGNFSRAGCSEGIPGQHCGAGTWGLICWSVLGSVVHTAGFPMSVPAADCCEAVSARSHWILKVLTTNPPHTHTDLLWFSLWMHVLLLSPIRCNSCHFLNCPKLLPQIQQKNQRVLRNFWWEKTCVPPPPPLPLSELRWNWLLHSMREETKCNHRKAFTQLEPTEGPSCETQVNGEVLFCTLMAPCYPLEHHLHHEKVMFIPQESLLALALLLGGLFCVLWDADVCFLSRSELTHPEAEQVALVLLKSVKLQQFVPAVKCRILRTFVPALPLVWDFTQPSWVRRGGDLRWGQILILLCVVFH